MIDLLTADQIRTNLQATMATAAPAMSPSIDTDEGVIIEMLVDALIGIQTQILAVENDAIVSEKTSTEGLDRHAAAHFAGGRKAATTTYNVVDGLAVTGTPGATVAAGDALVHVDGTRYQVTAGATCDGAGEAFADVQSISTGAACNKLPGEALTFESPPSGINSTAHVETYLRGGTDQESDADLLLRILDAIRNPPSGGRCSDYRQWAMEVPRVKTAYVYAPSSAAGDGRRGIGVVDVAFLVEGTRRYRIPAGAEEAELRLAVADYLLSKRPAGVGEVELLIPTRTDVNFDIRISPEHGYVWDWSAEGTTFHVNSFSPSTMILAWDATLPATVVAGVRLMIAGTMVRVVSLSSDHETVIDTNLSLSGGEAIYPAGPLTAPVQAAVLDQMDVLGPARGVGSDPDQVGWEDTVKLSKLFKTIIGTPGVGDATIVAPAANVVAVDSAPWSNAVQLLVAGTITVRPL